MIRRLVPLVILAVGVCAGPAGAGPAPAPVAATGQTICYQWTGTAVIDCAGTGQDGETLSGVAWPDPHFAENGDGTVTDRLTGLAWPRDAGAAVGSVSWDRALEQVKALNRQGYLGHDDWRLPNVGELASLADAQSGPAEWLSAQGFRGVPKDDYWTSTTYAAYPACAWSVGMFSGIVAARAKAEAGRVFAVRTAGEGAVRLPRTGQTGCYDRAGAIVPCAGTGQDGDLRAGAAWPDPRFAGNADGTVTDRLTGLVWTPDGGVPGPAACRPGTARTGQEALDHVRCLNENRYLGRSDWRLPNRNELASLVNRGEPDTAAWLNGAGFRNARAAGYWSSTTYAPTPWNSWGVNLHDGAVTSFARKHAINVWPVRGGK